MIIKLNKIQLIKINEKMHTYERSQEIMIIITTTRTEKYLLIAEMPKPQPHTKKIDDSM